MREMCPTLCRSPATSLHRPTPIAVPERLTYAPTLGATQSNLQPQGYTSPPKYTGQNLPSRTSANEQVSCVKDMGGGGVKSDEQVLLGLVQRAEIFFQNCSLWIEDFGRLNIKKHSQTQMTNDAVFSSLGLFF